MGETERAERARGKREREGDRWRGGWVAPLLSRTVLFCCHHLVCKAPGGVGGGEEGVGARAVAGGGMAHPLSLVWRRQSMSSGICCGRDGWNSWGSK